MDKMIKYKTITRRIKLLIKLHQPGVKSVVIKLYFLLVLDHTMRGRGSDELSVNVSCQHAQCECLCSVLLGGVFVLTSDIML